MPKRKLTLWIPLILLALLPSQAAAQRADAEQRRRDEEAVRNMEDHGYDFAVVTSTQAVIYEEPRANSRALMRVKRNEFLALVERQPAGPFYRVVEVESATEGWVHGRDVVVKLTASEGAGPAMEEERMDSDADPEVSVTNAEPSTNLNLRLNGKLYVIPAKTTKVLTLKPGTFKYYGYSPGIRPAFGTRTFRAGYRYTWSFEIVRR